MKNDDHIKDWLEGKLSADEIKKVMKEDSSMEEFEQIINTSSKMTPPQGKSKEQAWNDFMETIEEKEEQPAKVRRLNPYIPLSIAAVLVMAIVAYIFIFSNTYIKTEAGEQLTHTLPDGSKVTLNAASSISYNDFGWDSDRNVSLNGEAFFKVKEGGTFTVTGEKATIIVLGTSFNAYFREKTEVKCFEGSVSVKTEQGDFTLKKGEYTNTKEKAAFTPSQGASWTQGEFHYEGEPFINVLEELERQYAIDIVHKDLSNRVYTGFFDNKNLDEALQLVLKPMGLDYKKEDDKIIIQ